MGNHLREIKESLSYAPTASLSSYSHKADLKG